MSDQLLGDLKQNILTTCADVSQQELMSAIKQFAKPIKLIHKLEAEMYRL